MIAFIIKDDVKKKVLLYEYFSLDKVILLYGTQAKKTSNFATSLFIGQILLFILYLRNIYNLFNGYKVDFIC